MKKIIKVGFVDFWDNFKDSKIYKKIIKILKSKYKVIYDNKNPEYLFYSCFGNKNLDYKTAIKIFYTGECGTPNFNHCDYAIGFDYLDFEDRYLRYPIYMFSYDMENLTRKCYKKTKFCSYVVSNNFSAMKERKTIFELVSKYKKVDSGGGIFNNIGYRVKNKIKFLQPYKFNICFENTSYSGYITEKLIDAFAAGCIPIYFGDSKVGRYFNENAFINCHKFKNLEEVVQKIIELDNNDNLRINMLKQPIFVKQIVDDLSSFLYHIFDQDIQFARRRPDRIHTELFALNSK